MRSTSIYLRSLVITIKGISVRDIQRSIEEVAASRDMSIDALLKFYIGNGLREDKAKLFSDRQKFIN
ncbi:MULTISPECIES: hypothetical protein [Pseudanabaena]|uniref:hypothetical protein n=1 Tax=Pseudanabaena TaxID=1152 RepID=UPI002478668A|nr:MULTISPECIES: hypothetical protein [Pseudanabaena]MEA5489487.1 hypothetical protein [Pseudanabaena sp. CCNP1317]WGS74157.1 hypothetical protein OA858_09070 [Pseudanabaena galeata CCNP1313]